MASSDSNRSKGMQDYTLNLDGVNEQSINVIGDFVHVQAVSVGGTAVYLRFDDGPRVSRFEGQGNRVYYSRVTVSAAAACQVTLQLGSGYATDARATFTGSITVQDAPAATNPALADVACAAGAQTQLVGASGTRLGVYVGVSSTQANGVRVGDISTAAAQGVLIEPGQIVLFPSAAALYAYNSGGGAITVTLTALTS